MKINTGVFYSRYVVTNVFFKRGGFIALISTQHTSRVTKLFHCNNQFTTVFRQFNMDNCGAARFQQWKLLTNYTSFILTVKVTPWKWGQYIHPKYWDPYTWLRDSLNLNIPSLGRQRCLPSWSPRRTPWFFCNFSTVWCGRLLKLCFFWVSETIIQWFKHC